MALPMLYSRRKRAAQQKGDVYQYDVMSPKLRQQILFIFEYWNELLQAYGNNYPISTPIVAEMKKELGLPKLCSYPQSDHHEFKEWFLEHDELDDLLDAIEIGVMMAEYHANDRHDNSKQIVKDGISEINARALEDGFGFQIDDSQIMQIDTKFTHLEITIPALYLLNDSIYSGANREFRQAFEEYKSGNYDDCIHDCCNAFESVLKVILTQKNWEFNSTDSARKLLAIAFDNKLIPLYMQNEFNGLRAIFESGVPTVRNKEAGHGTGVNPRNIPKFIASFQLHQTAAAIILLAEAAK